MRIMKQVEAGMKTVEICPQYGIDQEAHQKEAKYGGLEANEGRQLKLTQLIISGGIDRAPPYWWIWFASNTQVSPG